jgi:hypothetical protein
MKNLIFIIITICCTIFWVNNTSAITVDFVPSHQTVKVGQEVVVYLHISGLEPGQKIGGFDIDIGFDSQLLKFEKVQFGSQLGDPLDNTETSTRLSLDHLDDNWFWIAEDTKLTPTELNQLQGFSVTVVKMVFTAKKVGTASFGGWGYYIGDQNGNTISGFYCCWAPVGATVTCQSDCRHPVGHLDYCRDCGPCAEGQGDCDSDSECQSGLNCAQVLGTDVCCSHPLGHLDYCRDCGPCAAGQGDCDNDGECQSGLTCVQIPGIDTCQ